jgi:hypothetical protein
MIVGIGDPISDKQVRQNNQDEGNFINWEMKTRALLF